MIAADCTLIAQLFLTTPETQLAQGVMLADDVWLVPPLWRSEFRSVLGKYLLHRDLSLEQCIEITSVAEPRMSAGETAVSSLAVMSLVAATRCSAYDAEYVSLAQSLSVPLVTSDRSLQKMFPSVAVSPVRFLSDLGVVPVVRANHEL